MKSHYIADKAKDNVSHGWIKLCQLTWLISTCSPTIFLGRLRKDSINLSIEFNLLLEFESPSKSWNIESAIRNKTFTPRMRVNKKLCSTPYPLIIQDLNF